MIKSLLELFLSGALIIFGLYKALDLYFKRNTQEGLIQGVQLDEETKRKFKAICNMECRTPREQEKYLIEKFIETYTTENQIDWNNTKY